MKNLLCWSFLILLGAFLINGYNQDRERTRQSLIEQHGSLEAYESAVAQDAENRRIQRLAEAVNQAERDRRAVMRYNFVQGVRIAEQRAAEAEAQGVQR